MVVTIGWTTSVSLLLFLVYGLYEQELHPVTAAAYSSFSHTLWALGLAWVVIACSTGYGGSVLTVSHLNLASFFLWVSDELNQRIYQNTYPVFRFRFCQQSLIVNSPVSIQQGYLLCLPCPSDPHQNIRYEDGQPNPFGKRPCGKLNRNQTFWNFNSKNITFNPTIVTAYS